MILINRIIYHYTLNLFPDLDTELKKANINTDPVLFTKRQFSKSLIYSSLLSVLALMVLLKEKYPILLIIPIFLAVTFICYSMLMAYPKYMIKKRRREIDSDLLYSCRHMLMAIESGVPVVRAIRETANIHTKSSKYFKEIISDLYMGRPFEKTLEYFIKYSPSDDFKGILTEIKNSILTGTDLTDGLKAILDDMAQKHLIEINEYGKKLNPMTVFYMIFGTIVPSLGIAIMTVGISFVSAIEIKLQHVIVIISFITMIQIFFILLFKSYQPNIDL